jgi:formyl-CoA transferase
LRILDFSHVLSGPFATMLLADLGAEIIKIEIAGRGDSTRLSGPPFQKVMSAYFACVNRNKRAHVWISRRKGESKSPSVW